MSGHSQVDEYCTQLRRREIEGALPCAKRTAELMRHLITSQKHLQASALIDDGLLSQAFNSQSKQVNRALSLSNLLDQGQIQVVDEDDGAAADAHDDHDGDSTVSRSKKGNKPQQWKGKHAVIEQLNELIDELDNIEHQISQQAVDHIHANEVILAFGQSETTFQFLREASKKRQFQVVVAEGAPRLGGRTMARRLAEVGIQTTLIADCAVFAMMARVNKVLVGGNAVLANGGVIAPVGLNLVALAAHKHSVPFVVLVGLHKLSPLFPHDPDVTMNEFKSPALVSDWSVVAEAFSSQKAVGNCMDALVNVHVPCPMFDYVPPELIRLFVTDTGGYTPSYVYRLLSEYYSREDYILVKEAAY